MSVWCCSTEQHHFMHIQNMENIIIVKYTRENEATLSDQQQLLIQGLLPLCYQGLLHNNLAIDQAGNWHNVIAQIPTNLVNSNKREIPQKLVAEGALEEFIYNDLFEQAFVKLNHVEKVNQTLTSLIETIKVAKWHGDKVQKILVISLKSTIKKEQLEVEITVKGYIFELKNERLIETTGEENYWFVYGKVQGFVFTDITKEGYQILQKVIESDVLEKFRELPYYNEFLLIGE